MRKLIPVILALLGIGGGVAAGLLHAPAPDADHAAAEQPAADHQVAENCTPPAGAGLIPAVAADGHGAAPGDREYFKFNNQFVVPVIGDGRIVSLVVLSLSMEIGPGTSEAAYQREPKLRDSMLQVLFDHANSGGFQGAYTDSSKLDPLRRVLFATARSIMGEGVTDVLITEIARQDS